MSKINKTILWVVAIIIVISLIWLGYSDKEVVRDEEVIKVGVIADLSGDYANVLKGGHRGVELAVEDLKKEIPNKEIELIIEDQKSCDKKETISIINKFISVDEVDIIIGGTCSSTTLAGAPIVENAKIIMISAISSAPSVSNAGEYIFRTYISDTFRGEEMGDLIYNNLGKRKLALITDISNDTYIEVNNKLKKTFESLGGEVVLEETTDEGVDFRTSLLKIKDKNPDVISFGLNPSSIIALLRQKTELGIDISIVSPLEMIEDSEIIEAVGNSAEGIIYAMPGNPPETEEYKELQRKFKEKYNEDMVQYTAESYDALMLGIKAVLASDGTKEDIKNKLYEVSKTYEGVSGNVEFDENGDVSKDVLFKVIREGKFIPYETQ